MSGVTTTRRWVIAARPLGRALLDSDFRLEECAVERPGEGDVLVRTTHLGFDPALKGWMENVDDPRNAQQTGPQNYLNVVFTNATIQGFLVMHYEQHYPVAYRRLEAWVRAGRLVPFDDVVQVVSRTQFEAAAATQAATSDAGAADAEAIAVLLFTSGTTGEPKAAVLRHRHLTSYVISTLEFMGAGEDEAALVSVPPYHIAAVSAVLTSTYLGRRVMHLLSFTPEEWVRLARDEAVTHAMVVPTMLGRVLDLLEAQGEGLPHLRHLSYGGGPMPAATIERALRLLPHVDFVNAYGLTETSSTIAVLTPDDHRVVLASDDPLVRRRLGSVGRPLPSIELSIRDPAGQSVAAGAEGEIWVRGEQVSGEYLNVKSQRHEGWFPTKDYGWLDAEGLLA